MIKPDVFPSQFSKAELSPNSSFELPYADMKISTTILLLAKKKKSQTNPKDTASLFIVLWIGFRLSEYSSNFVNLEGFFLYLTFSSTLTNLNNKLP